MKKFDLKRLFDIILYPLPYIFVFVGSIWSPVDADLGWHLRYGEYFYKHLSPLRGNPYSTMMPDFAWPNSSWVTDIITYSMFRLSGFVGISLASAFVVTLTFFFIARAFKLTFLKQAVFFPILLYLELPINNVSLRGQQLSLLFLAILLYLLNSYEKKVFHPKLKYAYLIPFLFLIWVNVHGEFLLGLGVLGIWIFGKIVSEFFTREKKEQIILLKKKQKDLYEPLWTPLHVGKVLKSLKFWSIVLFTSLIATFIDPFGFSIYQEAFVHVGNADLKYIAEYLPFQDLSSDWRNIFLTGSLLLIGVSVIFLSGKLVISLPNVLVVFVLFFLALWIKRFAWPFYYTTPAVLAAFLSFDEKDTKWSKLVGFIIITSAIIVVMFTQNPISTLRKASWDTYCKSYLDCSPQSADFLKKTTIKKPLWTNYNWGGWLIWNYPQIKPSIDGRMHLWRDETGYSAFNEYYPLEQDMKDIDASRYNTVYAWRAKPIIKRINQLVQEGRWRILYVDDSAVIAERIKPYDSIKLVQ